MQRRHFLKIFGAGVAGAAVVPLLPNAPVAAAAPIPVPQMSVDEAVEAFHQKVEDDLIAQVKSGNLHENPYRVTWADIGMLPARFPPR